MHNREPQERRDENSLGHALKEYLANHPGGAAKVAKDAKVAVGTVQRILRGKYPTPAEGPETWKRMRGRIEAVSRLAIFLTLDPKAVLSEFSIPTSDPEVLGLIESLRRQKALPPELSDPVLDRIIGRDRQVQTGIIFWEPFTRPAPLGVGGPGEDAALSELTLTSWAWAYLKVLLGTVDPTMRKALPIGIWSIEQGLDLLLEHPDQCDLLFGLYETSYRRTLGLEFIPVPGISAPLGGLATIPNVRWEDLIDESKPFRVYVMRREVGYLFMVGVGGYTTEVGDRDLIILKEDRESAMIEVLNELMQSHDDRPRVIVADNLTCEWFSSASPTTVWFERAGIANSDDQKKLREAWERLKYPVISSDAPVYPVGIAIRSDSPRWGRLLRTATRELFGNATTLVSLRFINLLQDQRGLDKLSPVPLEPTLSGYEARHFVDNIDKHWEQKDPSSSALKKWRENWKGVWLSQSGSSSGQKL